MTTTTYTRVIPRDFFNEAKLLKCMGQLSLKILDCNTPCKIEIEDCGDIFDIQLTDDGSLFISNYTITIKDKIVLFKTTYNSKSAYPFYCEIDYTDYEVFDDKGDFTDEFIALCNSIDIPSVNGINYKNVKKTCIIGISANLCDSIENRNGKRCKCVTNHFK